MAFVKVLLLNFAVAAARSQGQCSLPAAHLLTSGSTPLFYVIPGVGVAQGRTPLCELNSTNADVLKAACVATKGCAGFTLGSGGGEPGDLPPHDCRGSQLFSEADVHQHAINHSGIDLFVLGSEPANLITAVTPKPMKQAFPNALKTVSINRAQFRILKAPGVSSNSLLDAAMARYERLMFVGNEERDDRSNDMATGGATTQLLVHVIDLNAPLRLGMDESYNLAVQAGSSVLNASSVWGAMRGLETWSQLIVHGRGGPDSYFADVQMINDAPQYQFRGLMIDTARHFLPLDLIFTVIDGMSYEKLNVLHWHAVDDQSFPLEVRSLPRLAPRAAYGPRHIYSVENITAVVSYARSRGIRVVLELDTPGHCQVLQHAYPELGLITECPGTTCWPPLDVSKNSTMDFVKTLWKDLAQLFPDESVFIGGDECHTTCWAANANFAEWAKKKNLSITSTTESVGGEGTVFGWYIDQMVETVEGLGKRPMMWSPFYWDPASPPTKLVSSNAILNLWAGPVNELAFNMTLKGTNKVVTSVNWYLPASAYSHDPRELCSSNSSSPFFCSEEQRQRIVGGEACMWGESVDATNFFTSVWPDLTGAAERLWSPSAPQGGLDLFSGRQRRLRLHRCRMLSRGIPLGPMSAIYMPDASHASFNTWREFSWCPGDNQFTHIGKDLDSDPLSFGWGRQRAAEARAMAVAQPFDSSTSMEENIYV